MKIGAVVVAAGTGSRAGGEKPKQYQVIGGRPVVWWALKSFCDHPSIAHVQPVIGAGQDDLFASATQGLAIDPPVIGGETRQESCRRGLEAIARHHVTHVLIHDEEPLGPEFRAHAGQWKVRLAGEAPPVRLYEILPETTIDSGQELRNNTR